MHKKREACKQASENMGGKVVLDLGWTLLHPGYKHTTMAEGVKAYNAQFEGGINTPTDL